MDQPAQNQSHRGWIALLVVGLAGWGLYHAVGAFLFNHDVRRGLVVLACMSAFLVWWLLLLRLRSKRRQRESTPGG
jgi:hypothetical protein